MAKQALHPSDVIPQQKRQALKYNGFVPAGYQANPSVSVSIAT